MVGGRWEERHWNRDFDAFRRMDKETPCRPTVGLMFELMQRIVRLEKDKPTRVEMFDAIKIVVEALKKLQVSDEQLRSIFGETVGQTADSMHRTLNLVERLDERLTAVEEKLKEDSNGRG